MFKKIKELQIQEQDYNNTENLKNKIRTILNKKELVDLLKSN